MSTVGKRRSSKYCCFLLGSRYWLIEVLLRRPRYIVFPNLSLGINGNLAGFSRNRRALCFIYDASSQSFIGVIRCLDIALAVQLDEFYKENFYGVAVPTEWFWDKWGGVGIGVITTKPSYIHRLPQPLSVDTLGNIITKTCGSDLVRDVRELVEEACTSGFVITTIASVYKLFQAVQQFSQSPLKYYQMPLQQVEIANMLIDIGLKLGFKVDTLGLGKKSIDIVWRDRDTGRIAKIFKVCSIKRLAKVFEGVPNRKGIDSAEYWIALYDIEYGAIRVEEGLSLVGLSTGIDSDMVNVIGWREVLDVYRAVLGNSRKILYRL